MEREPHQPRDVAGYLSPFAEKLGIVCESISEDRAVYRMPFREDNVTVADLVHGGALLSLADCSVTGAAWSTVDDPEKYRGVTADISLSFVSGARSEDVVAVATVSRRGKSLCFCRVEILSAEGVLVAQGQAVYKLGRLLTPQETMAGLFTGKSAEEQMGLLADLEQTGAQVYRGFAEAETNGDARQSLLDNAEREETNAQVLRQILNGYSTAKR